MSFAHTRIRRNLSAPSPWTIPVQYQNFRIYIVGLRNRWSEEGWGSSGDVIKVLDRVRPVGVCVGVNGEVISEECNRSSWLLHSKRSPFFFLSNQEHEFPRIFKNLAGNAQTFLVDRPPETTANRFAEAAIKNPIQFAWWLSRWPKFYSASSLKTSSRTSRALQEVAPTLQRVLINEGSELMGYQLLRCLEYRLMLSHRRSLSPSNSSDHQPPPTHSVPLKPRPPFSDVLATPLLKAPTPVLWTQSPPPEPHGPGVIPPFETVALVVPRRYVLEIHRWVKGMRSEEGRRFLERNAEELPYLYRNERFDWCGRFPHMPSARAALSSPAVMVKPPPDRGTARRGEGEDPLMSRRIRELSERKVSMWPVFFVIYIFLPTLVVWELGRITRIAVRTLRSPVDETVEGQALARWRVENSGGGTKGNV